MCVGHWLLKHAKAYLVCIVCGQIDTSCCPVKGARYVLIDYQMLPLELVQNMYMQVETLYIQKYISSGLHGNRDLCVIAHASPRLLYSETRQIVQ